ncbi:MAG: aldo/keto reductase [Lachnospiraceae bacterium]|nr:aldo/keto reductase [Lachnospiraceae bacterium]
MAEKKLGFGLMRLPKLEDGKTIDLEATKTMVDMFLEAGFTYFDTAYVYDDGASEEAGREALVKRYDRDRYVIATKLNAALGSPDKEQAKAQLDISLSRLGLDYVDRYLLHAIQLNNIDTYNDFGLWDFVRREKDRGRIRSWGFSFHATPELLDEVLTTHPDAEFVQLQINYADWENANIQSRACYEVAKAHGKPIVVMEPVKGGLLATPPSSVRRIFDELGAEASPASYALRFAASLPGVETVLSGMSSIEQMRENISFMADMKPLSEAEAAAVAKAREAIMNAPTLDCTGCQYCMKGCPMNIQIPMILRALNDWRTYESMPQSMRRYGFALRAGAPASSCIACGQCEGACPQGLPIIDALAESSELFDKKGA